MKNRNIEVFIYVKPSETDKVPGLTDKINRLTGVIKARTNEYVKTILDVEYDPNAISSDVIVNNIRHKGVHIALVGM